MEYTNEFASSPAGGKTDLLFAEKENYYATALYLNLK